MKQLCPNPKCGAENALNDNVCPRCGTPQRQLLACGTILRGRYRIEAVRGCGGFGAVYRATDLQTGSPVAIKENHQHRTFARFEREAKLLMQLSHPNLPKVLDVFTDVQSGRAYMVMEFIEGETLQESVERKGNLTWQDAEPIFAQVVKALTYLHQQKIVHRDIKPSNIIVTKRMETVYVEVDDWEEVVAPPPKLTEEAIAKLTDEGRFKRGMNYWREHWRLENLQRNGWTLTGNCWGDLNPITHDRRYYQVSVTLQPKGVVGQSCTCSDFRGRRLCKHLIALLLAWVHEPQRFKVVNEKKERRRVKRRVPRQVERQHIVLVDFGVAKVMEEVDPNRPRSSSIVAWTDGYSPPEQYQSGVEIDDRADQYALAATMVFALTGKTPDDAFARMEKFRKGEPTLPPKPNEVPTTVWRAVEVAMSFEPEKRFADVQEFWKTACSQRSLPESPVASAGKRQNELRVMDAIMVAIVGVIVGAIIGAIVGVIRGAIWGVLFEGTIEGTIKGASEGIIEGTILGVIGGACGAIWGVILFAISGAEGGAKSVSAIWSAILFAIVCAIVGAIEGAKGGAISDAILFAILGAIVGAIWGAILGWKEGGR